MARSSDKNSHRFARKMNKQFVTGITFESTVKFSKEAWDRLVYPYLIQMINYFYCTPFGVDA